MTLWEHWPRCEEERGPCPSFILSAPFYPSVPFVPSDTQWLHISIPLPTPTYALAHTNIHRHTHSGLRPKIKVHIMCCLDIWQHWKGLEWLSYNLPSPPCSHRYSHLLKNPPYQRTSTVPAYSLAVGFTSLPVHGSFQASQSHAPVGTRGIPSSWYY